MIRRWSSILLRRARFVLVTGIIATIAAASYGLGVFDDLGQGGFDDPGTESAQELAREQAVFGNENVDLVVLYRSADQSVADPGFRQRVRAAVADYPDGTTTSVLTPWSTGAGDRPGCSRGSTGATC